MVAVACAFSVFIIIATGIRDNSIPERKLDCRMLIGSWHPDVPREAIEECRKKELNK
jgi:hypothetical protein